MKLSWQHSYISNMTSKFNKLVLDLVFGLWSEFIGLCMHAALQISLRIVYDCFTLVNAHQTSFWPVILLAQPDELKRSRLQRLRLIGRLPPADAWLLEYCETRGWLFPIRHRCETWRRHRNGNATASRSVRTGESRMDVIYCRAECCDDVGTSWETMSVCRMT